MTISDARLAEMVGAGVPCVPAQPGEIAAVVQELRKARAAVSTPTQGQKGEASELIAWLEERSKPDSGIRYGDNSSGVAEATFSGYDAAFVAEHFHGRGAARLACLLRTLSAYNARLREERNADQAELDHVSASIGSQRWMDPPDGGSVSLGEQVNRMRADLETAEARLSEAVEVLKPFGEYLASMPVDLDNEGKPVPDDQGVGWAYLTVGQFRAARQFLDTQGGGNG